MTVGGFQSNWFNVQNLTMENGKKLPIATLKDEYKDEFAALAQNKLEQMAGREPSKGLDALTEEQLKALAEKYDPEEMTHEEYQDFLNELVGMGALTETDRLLAGGTGPNGLIPVIPGASASVCDASMDGMGSSFTYDFPMGEDAIDVTEWVKYRASFDTIHYFGDKQYDLGEDEANRTVAAILQKMQSII